MTLINIGELIKNVTPALKDKNTDVPWREIAGLRDLAAHKYQTLKMEDVYITITTDLPNLKNMIINIVSALGVL